MTFIVTISSRVRLSIHKDYQTATREKYLALARYHVGPSSRDSKELWGKHDNISDGSKL